MQTNKEQLKKILDKVGIAPAEFDKLAKEAEDEGKEIKEYLIGKKIKIATTNPEDLEIFEFIRKKTGLELKINLTSPDSIKEGLKQYHKTLKAELNYLTNEDEQRDSEEDQDLKKIAEDLPVVRIVDTLLEYAVFEDASDIHIEPEEKEVSV